MHILIDLTLVSLFLFFTILFFRYGFARTAYKIGKTWLSFFCALILGPWLSSKIADLFVSEQLTNGINSTLTTLVETNANDYTLAQLFAALPDGFVSFLNKFGINFAQLEAEYGQSTYASEEIIYAISQKISAPCVEMISRIIGYVICFLVPWIVFIWLNLQIRNRRSRFFRCVDSVFGLLVGLTIGYCVASATALLISTLFQVTVCFNAESNVTSIYERSYILRFLSEFKTLEFVKQSFINIFSSVR